MWIRDGHLAPRHGGAQHGVFFRGLAAAVVVGADGVDGGQRLADDIAHGGVFGYRLASRRRCLSALAAMAIAIKLLSDTSWQKERTIVVGAVPMAQVAIEAMPKTAIKEADDSADQGLATDAVLKEGISDMTQSVAATTATLGENAPKREKSSCGSSGSSSHSSSSSSRSSSSTVRILRGIRTGEGQGRHRGVP